MSKKIKMAKKNRLICQGLLQDYNRIKRIKFGQSKRKSLVNMTIDNN